MTETEKLAKQHSEQMREAEKRDAVRLLCPMPPRLVVSHRDHIGLVFGDGFASMRFPPKPDAIATADTVRTLLEAFPPMECERRRSGCLATGPAAINGKRYADAPLDGVHYVALRLDGGRGYGPNLTAKWYAATASDGLLSVSVELVAHAPGVPRARKVSGSYHPVTGEPGPHVWSVDNPPADAVPISWAPGTPDSYIREWFFERLDDFRAWLNGYEVKS